MFPTVYHLSNLLISWYTPGAPTSSSLNSRYDSRHWIHAYLFAPCSPPNVIFPCGMSQEEEVSAGWDFHVFPHKTTKHPDRMHSWNSWITLSSALQRSSSFTTLSFTVRASLPIVAGRKPVKLRTELWVLGSFSENCSAFSSPPSAVDTGRIPSNEYPLSMIIWCFDGSPVWIPKRQREPGTKKRHLPSSVSPFCPYSIEPYHRVTSPVQWRCHSRNCCSSSAAWRCSWPFRKYCDKILCPSHDDCRISVQRAEGEFE